MPELRRVPEDRTRPGNATAAPVADECGFIYSFHFLSKLLLLSVFCVIGPRLYGQGTVYFSNIGAPGAIINSLTGQRAEAGTSFSVALYFAADGVTDESTFTQVGDSVNIGVDGGVPHSQLAGRLIGGVRTAPLVPPGAIGMFQVRAWETVFGTTYEDAVANPYYQNGRLALAGESGIMRVDTGDPTVYQLAASLVAPGIQTVVGAPLSDGFVLSVVPEPSSALLLLLTLPAIFLLRRGSK
jgi:hypothetical protein